MPVQASRRGAAGAPAAGGNIWPRRIRPPKGVLLVLYAVEFLCAGTSHIVSINTPERGAVVSSPAGETSLESQTFSFFLTSHRFRSLRQAQ